MVSILTHFNPSTLKVAYNNSSKKAIITPLVCPGCSGSGLPGSFSITATGLTDCGCHVPHDFRYDYGAVAEIFNDLEIPVRFITISSRGGQDVCRWQTRGPGGSLYYPLVGLSNIMNGTLIAGTTCPIDTGIALTFYRATIDMIYQPGTPYIDIKIEARRTTPADHVQIFRVQNYLYEGGDSCLTFANPIPNDLSSPCSNNMFACYGGTMTFNGV